MTVSTILSVVSLAVSQNTYAQAKTFKSFWTTKSKDYLDSPSKTDLGFFYNNSDLWFQEEARQRCVSQMALIDLPW